ncbi:MAG: tRNA lysidine(34) synthetase TilS [Mycobacterium leprae]
MLAQVREYVHQNNMIMQGDRVVVAVSGGPDSVTLLHLLHQLAANLDISLHVFHMDHGLRGEESRQDACFVQDLAEKLHLPCTVVTLPSGALKAEAGSLEANARRARYREIEALAHRIHANKVALGHNRDDQAETVLMRFLRGTGTHGLAGIAPVRTQDGLTYIRPLLAVPRHEIEAYCQQHALQPRLDASNMKADYYRNHIRLELLPHLTRTYNPALSHNLWQTANVLYEEDRLLERLSTEAFARCLVDGEGVTLRGSVLCSEPLALARRVIRLAGRAVVGSDFDMGLESVDRVLKAAANTHGTHEVHLANGLQVWVEYGLCRFRCQSEPFCAGGGGEWPVVSGGVTQVPELSLSLEVQVVAWTEGFRKEDAKQEAYFDLAALPGPLSIRFRRPGDRLWPVGMDGSKKLQDIMVDAKVPRRLRESIPLLVAGDEVLWIIGYRLDRRFLANAQSSAVLAVNVRGLEVGT